MNIENHNSIDTPQVFTLGTKLGAGGVGDVYEVKGKDDLVIKLFSDASNGNSPKGNSLEEAKWMRIMQNQYGSKYTPYCYGVVDTNYGQGILMERLSMTLAEVVQQNPPDLLQTIGWLRQIAEALDAFGNLGIIFRDLKESNVMLDKNRKVRLIDLGSCTYVNSNAILQGTNTFICPQYLNTRKPSSYKTDQYSLAILASALLGGKVISNKIVYFDEFSGLTQGQLTILNGSGGISKVNLPHDPLAKILTSSGISGISLIIVYPNNLVEISVLETFEKISPTAVLLLGSNFDLANRYPTNTAFVNALAISLGFENSL